MPVVVDSDGTHLASPDDLADVLARPLTTDEAARAQRRLDRAQELLAARIPNLVARVGGMPPAISGGAAAETIATIVARQMRNPDGVTSRQRGAGPFTRTDSYRDQDSPGELLVTEADVRSVLGATASRMVGSFRVGSIYPFGPRPNCR